jgi:NAD(P)-dependent dehydrogenase (short-subunit alcohol dehydrogenase family)
MSSPVCLITGANRGIGFGFVKELINRGCTVVATCRNPAAADDLRDLLEAKKQSPPLACDIGNDQSIKECFAKVAKLQSRIDFLVNNAGVSTPNHPDDPPTGIKREDLMAVLNVNVAGVAAMTQAFLPLVKASEVGGKVINIGSQLGSIERTMQKRKE